MFLGLRQFGVQFSPPGLGIGQALGGGSPGRLRGGSLDLGGGGGILQTRHGSVHNVAPLPALQCLFFQRVQLVPQGGNALVQLVHGGAQGVDGGAVGGGFLLDGLSALPGALQLRRRFVNAEAAVFALVFQDGDFTLAARVLLGHGADIGVCLLDIQHQALRFLAQGRAFFIKRIQLAAQAVIVCLGCLVLALLVAQRFVGAADGIDPQSDFQRFALFGKLQKLLGFFAVAL